MSSPARRPDPPMRFKRVVEGESVKTEIWAAFCMWCMAGLALYQGVNIPECLGSRLSLLFDGAMFGVCALLCSLYVYEAVRTYRGRRVYYVRV